MERDVVERVARVARINLTDVELEEFKDDLEEILGYFEILDSAPSSMIDDDVIGVLRDDEPQLLIDPKDLLKDMKTYEGYVRGPKLS